LEVKVPIEFFEPPVEVPTDGGLRLIFVGYVLGILSIFAFGASIYLRNIYLFIASPVALMWAIVIAWFGGEKIEEAKNRRLSQ
jgi:hypothetical protein